MSRMEASEKRRIVEALILSSAEPLSAAKIAEIIPYCNEGQAKDLVNELNTEYSVCPDLRSRRWRSSRIDSLSPEQRWKTCAASMPVRR